MVKGWIDDSGETYEKVIDIACADGLPVDPDTGRCADNGASVDLTTCAFDEGVGAAQLSVTGRTLISTRIIRRFITFAWS